MRNERTLHLAARLAAGLLVAVVLLAAGPAARIDDATDHPGGRIVLGSDNVLFNGRRAARVGDMVVCPVVEPGPVPHVGGPIASGSSTVLINGRRAARRGDMVVEQLRPALIATGSVNVVIGD